MKKVFVVTGELSGEKIGAWYVREHLHAADCHLEGIGGDELFQSGVRLYDRFETLNLVGVFEIVGALPRILSYIKKLVNYIIANKFDEVVLVDFPGFNLRLARLLKKRLSSIKITYVSPPQLWVWGAWRAKKLARYTDEIVVLYPFEVNWYAERGIAVQWHGYPFYEQLAGELVPANERKPQIALLPGSRQVELATLLPLFAAVIRKLKLMHPYLEVIVPRAESIPRAALELALRAQGLRPTGSDVHIIEGQAAKRAALASCAFALAKPGTNTLELAFLGVPTFVGYRTSWLTYGLAWPLVKVRYMALPNLLLPEPVFPEFIQSDFSLSKVHQALEEAYRSYSKGDSDYSNWCTRAAQIRRILAK